MERLEEHLFRMRKPHPGEGVFDTVVTCPVGQECEAKSSTRERASVTPGDRMPTVTRARADGRAECSFRRGQLVTGVSVADAHSPPASLTGDSLSPVQ